MSRLIPILLIPLAIAALSSCPALATKVDIDPAQLPTDPWVSYVVAWGLADSETNVNLCTRQDNTGALVECHPKMPDPQVSGRNYGQGDASSRFDTQTGSGVNSASVAIFKAALNPFAAAAAYARSGGTAKKAGRNGTPVTILLNGGLKLTGIDGTVDEKITIVLSNLGPLQLNGSLLKQIMTPEAFQKFRESAKAEGFDVVDAPPKEHLKIEVEFRGDAAWPDIIFAEAPQLCTYNDFDPETGAGCNPTKEIIRQSHFRDRCQMPNPPKACSDPKKKVRSTSQMAFTVWIPFSGETEPIAIDELHCTKERYNQGNKKEPVCLELKRPIK